MDELSGMAGSTEERAVIDEDDEWATDFDDDEDCFDSLDLT